MPQLQARQRQLRLHAALVADQFMPFVDDDRAQVAKLLARIGARQHQGQAFGRGDQCRRRLGGLPGFLRTGGVAGARADAAIEAQRGQRRLQCAHRIGSQRAHRRDPQQRQRFGRNVGRHGGMTHPHPLPLSLRERGDNAPKLRFNGKEGAEPHRVGLAGTSARVQQPGFTGRHARPDFALKGERLPAARGEPFLYRDRRADRNRIICRPRRMKIQRRLLGA